MKRASIYRTLATLALLGTGFGGGFLVGNRQTKSNDPKIRVFNEDFELQVRYKGILAERVDSIGEKRMGMLLSKHLYDLAGDMVLTPERLEIMQSHYAEYLLKKLDILRDWSRSYNIQEEQATIDLQG